jgi:hypothetical protein
MTPPQPELATAPSTRGRISRLLMWLGVLSAVASFLLAEPLGSRLGMVFVWRGWRPAPDRPAPPTTQLDEATLVEALTRIHQACAPDQTLDDALRGVVRALAQELGARNARASRVGTVAGRSQLATLVDLAPPGARRPLARPGKVAIAADASLLQRAIANGGVVSDPPHGHAVAVPGTSGVVAVVDFDALELEVDPAVLSRLLDAVHQALAGVAARPADRGAVMAGLGGSADAVGFLASINADREVGLFVLEPQHLRLVAVSRRAERDFGVRRQRVRCADRTKPRHRTAQRADGKSNDRASPHLAQPARPAWRAPEFVCVARTRHRAALAGWNGAPVAPRGRARC